MRVILHEEKYGHLPGWENEAPLLIRHDEVTLNEDFPLISDFEVVLAKGKGSIDGYGVIFFSQEKGMVASTLFRDRDLRKKGFAIPLNFQDLDQGWRMSILEKDGFVYIWESDFDDPDSGIFRWFKVPQEHYLSEWLLAIEASLQLSEEETENQRRLRLDPPGQSLYSLFMLSKLEGWAVGGTFEQDGYPRSGCFLHYFHGKWISQYVGTPLFDISFASANDGWAVGSQGAMFHFDGNTWERRERFTESTLRSVYMSGTTAGWAVGDNGVVLRYDGTTWSGEIVYPTIVPLHWIIRDDGAMVSDEDPLRPIRISLQCVVMHSPDDGWMVGDNGYIFHYNGQKWTHIWDFSYHLNSLSLVSSEEWWAVGEKATVMHYKKPSMNDGYQLDAGSHYSVAMLSEQEGWSFGANGTILKYNGSTWEVQPSNISKDLRGSCMISSDEGWCVGQDNTILHYQDGVWQKVDVK